MPYVAFTTAGVGGAVGGVGVVRCSDLRTGRLEVVLSGVAPSTIERTLYIDAVSSAV